MSHTDAYHNTVDESPTKEGDGYINDSVSYRLKISKN